MSGWLALLLIIPLLALPRRRHRAGWSGSRVRADLHLGNFGCVRRQRSFGSRPFQASGAFGRTGRGGAE